jgi:ABC-type dipeptide/oligopeptide/nickel transport system permease subunit
MNNGMMRIADAFLAFPVLPAVIFVRQIIGAILEQTGAMLVRGEWYAQDTFTSFQNVLLSLDPVMWSLILLSWMPYARLVNTSVLRLRGTAYVQAAKALGAGHARIVLRHLLPNAISPAIVLAARDVGGMVILQATFAFIGVGGNSPWGAMLGIGRNWIIGPGGNPLVYWWTYLPTIAALVVFGVGWSLFGDLLNDWLNPRQVM